MSRDLGPAPRRDLLGARPGADAAAALAASCARAAVSRPSCPPPRRSSSSGSGSRERARAVLRSAGGRRGRALGRPVERAGHARRDRLRRGVPRGCSRRSPTRPSSSSRSDSLERLRLPAVAIVGSRDATRYGRDVAARLARELSPAGVTVVSGFARGVDAAAHEAALEGPGGTIAVLGCGLDVDYPREHARLKEAVAATRPSPLGVSAGHRAAPAELSRSATASSRVSAPESSSSRRRGAAGRSSRRASPPTSAATSSPCPGASSRETSVGHARAAARRRDPLPRRRGRPRRALPVDRHARQPRPRGPPRAPADFRPRRGASRGAPHARSRSRPRSSRRRSIFPPRPCSPRLFELEGAGLAAVGEGGRYGVRRT